CYGIIALGGGSVIDSAKSVALLSAHPGPLGQYAGHPEMVSASSAPIIAIPTTAGTGSEVSRGGGIHPDATSRGFSIGGDSLQPKRVICDPELTLSLPPVLTAGTGMDALSHAIEGFISPLTNPPVDAIALDAVRRVKRNIERVVEDGSNRHARWQMMMAALEGGMAISKGLGPAHAISLICGDQGLHHGTLVTVAMPAVIRFAESTLSGQGHGSDKMGRLAHAIGLRKGADVAGEIERLNNAVGMPSTIAEMGYKMGDLDEMAEAAQIHRFNDTAPRRPSQGDYKTLLGELLG
ncbi:MAG: iron-containing alcohol dehydrogenase, partial [Rhodospirillales bacterium]|nr:iron-containing alcohol dehydrogenase [Rhodospirillales bacterium]